MIKSRSKSVIGRRMRDVEREIRELEGDIKLLSRSIERSGLDVSELERIADEKKGDAGSADIAPAQEYGYQGDHIARPARVDGDERFASYLASSFQSFHPLKKEKRNQRNKAVTMIICVLLMLVWIIWHLLK